MGIFDLFGGSPEKRLKSLQKKVTEKYGPPENRQKAIEQLLSIGTPEAISTLLARFTIAAEPSITDAEEKDYACQSILEFGEKAVDPLKEFLRRSELATSWALKMLRQLVPEPELVTICIEQLKALGNEYTRDPQKKHVLIDALAEMKDERIAPALAPFLEDPADDIRIATASALARHKDERTREPMLRAFVDSTDRARVVAALTAALADCGFGVQGFREKVESRLPEGYYVDRAGLVRRRD